MEMDGEITKHRAPTNLTIDRMILRETLEKQHLNVPRTESQLIQSQDLVSCLRVQSPRRWVMDLLLVLTGNHPLA